MYTHQKIENNVSRRGHVYLIGFNWLKRLQYNICILNARVCYINLNYFKMSQKNYMPFMYNYCSILFIIRIIIIDTTVDEIIISSINIIYCNTIMYYISKLAHIVGELRRKYTVHYVNI